MNTQLAFDADLMAPPPMARRSDPETSKQAAASARELQAHHHAVILAALRKHGDAGKDRLGALTNLTGVAICRRLPELQRLGLIELTGKTVPSTSGRQEREWRLST
jgi:predicted ArsR family transcriptional regulator